jgi:hypothetical protein
MTQNVARRFSSRLPITSSHINSLCLARMLQLLKISQSKARLKVHIHALAEGSPPALARLASSGSRRPSPIATALVDELGCRHFVCCGGCVG